MDQADREVLNADDLLQGDSRSSRIHVTTHNMAGVAGKALQEFRRDQVSGVQDHIHRSENILHQVLQKSLGIVGVRKMGVGKHPDPQSGARSTIH